jgi:hypothetical protein
MKKSTAEIVREYGPFPGADRVHGVTFDGELWHGTWEGEASDLRRIDPTSGELLEQIDMPEDLVVSGLETDGDGQFLCGGADSGRIRVVRRPKRSTAG